MCVVYTNNLLINGCVNGITISRILRANIATDETPDLQTNLN